MQIQAEPLSSEQPAAASPDGAATATGVVTPPTQDDYLTKLLKYVPPEIIGAYIFISGILFRSASVANRGRSDAFEASENFFHTPKTTRAEGRFLFRHAGR